ncbi:MAG: hypothetical protein F4X01_00780 [Nitrospira sp. SB0661_bin_20]|nr:hypothetical protein [Nitrospira sp. SB0661_bin_20]MYJ23035.1 hypothetical protein [Nitrospira sp. SB0673_bin_12]
MSYVKPQDVISPKDRWKLDRILYDGGEDQWAVAKGTWDEEETLVIRWNGRTGKKLGQPQSSGHPTWFIVPDELVGVIRAVIDLLLENEKK